MSDERPIVIIGTGLAGYSLAREIRKLDGTVAITLFSQDDAHSYSKPMLSTGFTKNKTADELSMADPAKMADQLGVSIRSRTRVDSINTAEQYLIVDGAKQTYQKLVLATGANVRRLNFPGSDSERVVSVNDLMDYRYFRQLLEGGKKHVLIMGAGLIGCEYANDLISGGHQVSIVDPADSALNGLIPQQAGKALLAGLESAGADLYMGRTVKQLDDQGGALTASLSDNTSIGCDLVLSAVGISPNIELARSADIACNRGIITNRLLETSAPNVYALGDCAEVDGHVLLYVLPLMACARALAKTLTGSATEVSYGVMPVVTKTPCCPVVVCPPMTSKGEWQFEQEGNNITGKFFSPSGELVGFVLTGDCISQKQALAKEVPAIHA